MLIRRVKDTKKARPMPARKEDNLNNGEQKGPERWRRRLYRRTIFTDGRPSEQSRKQPKRIISNPNNSTGDPHDETATRVI